ncbi:MAG: hypothetical protein IJI05_05195 [Erysipelotrichaceae bacterium]|nr:hypothetical protein [Erysipelotrichaceae bacterium]
MSNENAYRLVHNGKKAVRRDYSKVSGTLELPNLVEIQTSSFDWFKNEGLREVFEEIYPIENRDGNITLRLIDYKFEEPKYSPIECKIRELTYSSRIYATMELVVEDTATGEVSRKEEEVFLGEFPILTPTGTFIINGAERVIVSQIVRSPGAYFSMDVEDRTGRDIYNSELIPSRGTWLEFMTDNKKSNIGRIINVSVDRKRKIISSILLKAIGMSLAAERGEDTFGTEDFKKFMAAMNWPVYDIQDDTNQREFLNLYLLLYTAIFGDYEEVANTLISDKESQLTALVAIYENQRPDERPTEEGASNLINA